MSLPAILPFAQEQIRKSLFDGAIAVDATAGNGHDTLFLAKAVGASGHVYSFDIQQEALEHTRHRLHSEGVEARVTLYRRGHQFMREVLPKQVYGRVAAMMFNLGYLPRGDRQVTTRAETTITALEQGLPLLAPYGVCTLVLYTGHPGGEKEADAVISFTKELDPKQYAAAWYQMLNRNHAPSVVAIKRVR
jgi:predicted methyltransferase